MNHLNLIMICDPGPDPDDAKAILMAGKMHAENRLNLLGVICMGGHEAYNRAILARRLLDNAFPDNDIPVAEGAPGIKKTPKEFEYNIPSASENETIIQASSLFETVLNDADPKSIWIQIQAGFTDVYKAMCADMYLFKSKVKGMSIMGGLEDKYAESPTSDQSFNNTLDTVSANEVYRFCYLHTDVELIIVNRNAVPSMKRFPTGITNNVVKNYLSEAETKGLYGLYQNIVDDKMPARCDKQWFYETFCTQRDFMGGHLLPDKIPLTDFGKMLHGYQKPYDPITLLAACKIKTLFDWKSAKVRDGYWYFDTPGQIIV